MEHSISLNVPDCLSPILRQCLFWQPDRLAVSAWIEHVPFAFWIVDTLRPQTIVELGTHTGVSYSAMCQAIINLNLEAKCYAIDTWAGDEQAGYYSEEVYADFAKYHDRKFSAFSKMVRSTFDDALPHFEDGSIDLLHIDGLHTYEAVRHDFNSWRPKLSKNAVVMFHDTNVRERDFGVFKLWKEISKNSLSFEFLHCYGLGVLAIGDDYSDPLKFLLEAGRKPDLILLIRDIFYSLGSRSQLALNALELSKRVSEQNNYINAIERSICWRLTKPLRYVQKRLSFEAERPPQ